MIFELVVETVFMRKGSLTKEREILLLYPGGRCSVGRTPKNKVVRGCVNMSREHGVLAHGDGACVYTVRKRTTLMFIDGVGHTNHLSDNQAYILPPTCTITFCKRGTRVAKAAETAEVTMHVRPLPPFKVCFTMVAKEAQPRIDKLLRELSDAARFEAEIQNATHLIAPVQRKSLKFLHALCTQKPIVTVAWLEAMATPFKPNAEKCIPLPHIETFFPDPDPEEVEAGIGRGRANTSQLIGQTQMTQFGSTQVNVRMHAKDKCADPKLPRSQILAGKIVVLLCCKDEPEWVVILQACGACVVSVRLDRNEHASLAKIPTLATTDREPVLFQWGEYPADRLVLKRVSKQHGFAVITSHRLSGAIFSAEEPIKDVPPPRMTATQMEAHDEITANLIPTSISQSVNTISNAAPVGTPDAAATSGGVRRGSHSTKRQRGVVDYSGQGAIMKVAAMRRDLQFCTPLISVSALPPSSSSSSARRSARHGRHSAEKSPSDIEENNVAVAVSDLFTDDISLEAPMTVSMAPIVNAEDEQELEPTAITGRGNDAVVVDGKDEQGTPMAHDDKTFRETRTSTQRSKVRETATITTTEPVSVVVPSPPPSLSSGVPSGHGVGQANERGDEDDGWETRLEKRVANRDETEERVPIRSVIDEKKASQHEGAVPRGDLPQEMEVDMGSHEEGDEGDDGNSGATADEKGDAIFELTSSGWWRRANPVPGGGDDGDDGSADVDDYHGATAPNNVTRSAPSSSPEVRPNNRAGRRAFFKPPLRMPLESEYETEFIRCQPKESERMIQHRLAEAELAARRVRADEMMEDITTQGRSKSRVGRRR